MTPVLAATDGEIVSVGERSQPDLPRSAVSPRYDVVYIRDDRGWYYRYSHLHSINTAIRLGRRVTAGQQIGVIGKEGGSGGWSHLHFEIKSLQPSGRWGTQDGYAFLWQAYLARHDPRLIAVARPRHLALTGEMVTLDGSRSWAGAGIRSYQWRMSDGSSATGPRVKRSYARPGTYNEVLEVTDNEGRIDRDFAIVKVFDRKQPELTTPGIHAAFYPTLNVTAGDPIVFQVRARSTSEGVDIWDFGDGSPPVRVRSNVDPSNHAPDGYAATVHRYREPGRYIATVRRETALGTALDRLDVVVQPP